MASYYGFSSVGLLCFANLLIFGLALGSSKSTSYRPRYIRGARSADRPGHATETNTCQNIRDVPADLRKPGGMRPEPLGKFYHKYTETYGIPILGSKLVDDDALRRFCYVVRFLLAGNSNVRDTVYREYGHFVIISPQENVTDVPEFSSFGEAYNTDRGFMGGGRGNPTTVAGQRNALCDPSDIQGPEDILLFETAQACHLIGATDAIPGWYDRLQQAYNGAKARGLWRNTYNIEDIHEYFARGTQSFFNVRYFEPKPSGLHGPITTRDRLKAYDPTLYQLIWEVFPCNNPYITRCLGTRKEEDAQKLMMNCNIGGEKYSYCHNERGLGKCKYDRKFMDKFCPNVCLDDHELEDKSSYCESMAKKGECVSDPGYMLVNCQKSCYKIKHSERANKHPSCPDWASKGFCQGVYADYMAAVCEESCSNPKPKDINSLCSGWASKGECTSNPMYMIPNCPVSCEKHLNSILADDHPLCEPWADQGKCVDNPGFMFDRCQRSCYQKMEEDKETDKVKNCRTYGALDDIMRNACENHDWMKTDCRKTCQDVIFSQLDNKASECQQRANRGECTQYDMLVSCPTFCFSHTPPDLKDSAWACFAIATRERCLDKTNYVEAFCPKTCGITK